MKKPLDKTEAFQNVDDAIAEHQTQRSVMTDEIAIADYDKLLVHLGFREPDQCDCDISAI